MQIKNPANLENLVKITVQTKNIKKTNNIKSYKL